MSDLYILDCGLGSELKRKGFDLPDWTNSIWSAQAIIDEPDLIVEIHKDSIEAGSTVITTSNYYATPLILKDKQSKLNFETDFAACINSSPEGISDGFKPLVFQLSQTFLKCCDATSAAISPSKIDAIVSHSIASTLPL